jgi:mannose-6-phosphate isomerase-like protein (cupin superfamily)
MEWSRRNLCLALPALLASGYVAADETQKKTLPSHIYQFDDLSARTSGKLIYRGFLDGMLFEGCHVSLHESDLAPNSIPHPPHKHRHEEMVLVVEGKLQFTINGKATTVGEGSVMLVGSNDEHGIRNPEESIHAKYFVMALGPENQ